MPVGTVDYLHGLLLPSASFISQLEDLTPASNTELVTGYAAGHPDPLFRAVAGQTPDVRFSTPQLALALAGIGLYGVDLSGGNTDLYYKKAVDLGVREAAASTVHKRIRATQGMMVWDQIRATHQQTATITCRMIPTYDGTNAPFAALGSVALAGTPTAAEYFTLGRVKINGTFLPSVQEVSYSLRPQLNIVGSEGEVWPTHVDVQTHDPMVTLTGKALQPWIDYGLAGGAITSIVVYFRKKLKNGHNVPDGTAQHIALTSSDGIIVPESIRGGGSRSADASVSFYVNAPSAAAAHSAISTAAAIA